jgi:hypothetical protein
MSKFKIKSFFINFLYLFIKPLKGVKLNYNINPNKHFSRGDGLLPKYIESNEITFSILFSENSNVYIKDNPRQINKAFGLKEGIIPNKNSVMLGYSTFNDNFELWIFANDNKKGFKSEKIGNFKTEEWIENIKLGIDDNNYYLEYKSKKFKIERNLSNNVPDKLGIIRPYFGGKRPNPNKSAIKINIKLLT